MTKAFDQIVDFVATGGLREDLIRFAADNETRERVAWLIQKEKADGLLPEETTELDDYMRLEHLIRMAKTRARRNG
jgi:hypothetical protein